MILPDHIWVGRVYPCLGTLDLGVLAASCTAQRRLARSALLVRENQAPDLRAAVRKLERHFSYHHSAYIHGTGLRAMARQFLDGHISGITVPDVLVYEKIIMDRYSPWQNRDVATWPLMRYHSAGGDVWRLTVKSVLMELLSGPCVRAVYGTHVHLLRFLICENGQYFLPKSVRNMYGEPHTFYSWGYYCRMTGAESVFSQHPRLDGRVPGACISATGSVL